MAEDKNKKGASSRAGDENGVRRNFPTKEVPALSLNEHKQYSDVHPQIGDADLEDVLAHYPEYFEKLHARGATGEEKEFIARKEGVSEQELRSRFYDALPIIYLTALFESWQVLQ